VPFFLNIHNISKTSFKSDKNARFIALEIWMLVFYQEKTGLYVLMSYNVIEQEVKTPIICDGFTFLKNGELCYFKDGEDQTRHHVIQIWQTPFISGDIIPSEHTDSYLYKVGNKDIVKAMAECSEVMTLLNLVEQ
jgi:hypothetical protein